MNKRSRSSSQQCSCPSLPNIKTSNNVATSSTQPVSSYTYFIKEEDIVSPHSKYEQNESSASGDFRFTRDFFIVDQSDVVSPIHGFILQKITKMVNVTVPDAKKTILTTSDDISDYTSGAVTHMSDTYVEAFIVKNGHVENADQFQNASILRYKRTKRGVKIAPNAPNTLGTITQIGEYYFIPSRFTDVNDIQNEIVTNYIMPIDGHPAANGLPSSSDLSIYENNKGNKITPEYKFTLTVSWDYDENDSRVDRETINYGGNRKKRSINRKNRNKKRKTRKSV